MTVAPLRVRAGAVVPLPFRWASFTRENHTAGSTVAGSTVGSQGMAATGAVDVMAGVAGSGWD
jgi:hypothetical protein